MITIVRSTERGLVTMNEPVNGSWLSVIDPSPDEVRRLQELGIRYDYITYSLDMDERPRTEREEGDVFIVLRIPYFGGDTADVPYTTIPLGIILTGDKYITTVCKNHNDIIAEFVSGRARDLSTAKRNRFILRLLLSSANRYLSHLREINRKVEGLEDQLQRSIRNKEVLGLLKYEKSLTYFTTALRANEVVMRHLERGHFFEMYPDDEDLLEDVLTENEQAIEMTNVATNILADMMDAFTSIISNNLNQIMKLMTSIAIILAFPTIVASFYGMNVGLPLQDYSFAFPVTLAVSFAISLSVAMILRKLDWL